MILLRSTLFNIWFFALSTVMSIVGALALPFFPHSTLGIAQFWSRLVVGGLRVTCGIRVQVRGLERLPKDGPVLIASRHQSAFDTIVWMTLIPRGAYVLKRELLRIPVLGKLFPRAGQIPVHREGGAAALRALLRETDIAVRSDRQIIIFPEGSRGDPGHMLPLQPGIAAMSARSGLPVFPVVTDSGLHWGRRAFRKSPGTIHITVLPPLAPPGPEPGARLRLMRELTEVLAQSPEGCG